MVVTETIQLEGIRCERCVMRLAKVLVPLSAALTTLLLGVGLYLAWFVAPPDYQQGETVRIMYLHVPAAWLAMAVYVVMTSAALGTLVWRHPLADAAQRPAAALGAGFTLLCLGTGHRFVRAYHLAPAPLARR